MVAITYNSFPGIPVKFQFKMLTEGTDENCPTFPKISDFNVLGKKTTLVKTASKLLTKYGGEWSGRNFDPPNLKFLGLYSQIPNST